jgi:hypothetical protein
MFSNKDYRICWRNVLNGDKLGLNSLTSAELRKLAGRLGYTYFLISQEVYRTGDCGYVAPAEHLGLED